MTKTFHIFTFLCLVALFACNSHTPVFPEIGIETVDTIPDDGSVPAIITLVHDSATRAWEGEVRKRGGMSRKYEKESYKITLRHKEGIMGLEEDEDWILNANYIDKTFMRHVLSYRLFMGMDANNVAPHCRYTDLYLNGNYRGLYVMMEQLERKRLNTDQSDPKAFIMKEPPVFRTERNDIIDYSLAELFSHPEMPDSSLLIELDRTFDLLMNGSPEEVVAFTKETFDWNNIADWHLLTMLTNNGDGIVKGFYLFRRGSGQPMLFSPWDYDHCCGRDGDGESNMLETRADPERNLLIKRLMESESYRSHLYNRWLTHREGFITTANLLEMIDELETTIERAAYRNNQLWPEDAHWYHDDMSHKEEVDLMKDYFVKIMPLLDEEIANLVVTE